MDSLPAKPGTALDSFMADSRRHDSLAVPLSRRVRRFLVGLVLVEVACALVHRLLVQPNAEGVVAQVLSLGGHWTLASVLMVGDALGLCALGAATRGFGQATAAQMRAVIALAIVGVLACAPTLVLGVVVVAIAVVTVVLLVSLAIGLILSGPE